MDIKYKKLTEVELETFVDMRIKQLTDDVDSLISEVKKSGYEVFVEPNDVDIPATPVYPIRMAFCYGPLGEQIEFFCER